MFRNVMEFMFTVAMFSLPVGAFAGLVFGLVATLTGQTPHSLRAGPTARTET
jgi:hypothetical protein